MYYTEGDMGGGVTFAVVTPDGIPISNEETVAADSAPVEVTLPDEMLTAEQ